MLKIKIDHVLEFRVTVLWVMIDKQVQWLQILKKCIKFKTWAMNGKNDSLVKLYQKILR